MSKSSSARPLMNRPFETVCRWLAGVALPLCLALAFSVGCSGRVDYMKGVEEDLRFRSKHVAALPEPRRDESLTTAEWIDRGVPSPSREWNSSEYNTAVWTIEREQDSAKPLMPKMGSARSGDLFAKIFAFRPELLKEVDRADHYAICNALLSLELSRLWYLEGRYVNAHARSGAYDVELTEFQISEVKLWVHKLKSATRLYDKGSTPLPHRNMTEVDDLRHQLGGAVILSMPCLIDQRAFGPTARRRLARYYVDNFPSFAGEFLPEHRTQIDGLLVRVESGDADPEVRRLVGSARQALAKTTVSLLQQAAARRGLR